MAPNLPLEEAVRPFVEVDPESEPSRQAYVKFVEVKSEDEVRWWSKDTVAVVTGSNKGIGYEVVRQLATAGITTILTARNERRGLGAVAALKAEGLENVLFHPLDVTSSASAARLASWIKEKFGGIDIMVACAGVGGEGTEHTYESAKFILKTNYSGQKLVTSALLPLLRPSAAGARLIYVDAEFGEMKYLESDTLKDLLDDVDHLTEETLDTLISAYLEDVKKGKDTEWATEYARQYVPSKILVSKVLLNAYVRVLAKSLADRPDGKKIYVNSMTPGLTATEMSTSSLSGVPMRSIQHGADTAVWLALLPTGGPTGKFFRDRAEFPF